MATINFTQPGYYKCQEIVPNYQDRYPICVEYFSELPKSRNYIFYEYYGYYKPYELEVDADPETGQKTSTIVHK